MRHSPIVDAQKNVIPKRRSGLMLRCMDDEAVLYDTAHHAVYYLNDTALAMWQRADGQTSSDSLFPKMRDDVDDSVEIEEYMLRAVDTMVDHGLLERDLPTDG